MRTSFTRYGAILLVLGIIASVSAASTIRPLGPLRGYLPEDNAVPGWTKDAEPQEYEGEDLYTYIDGGAEIYQEYGFLRVIVQDYKNAGGRSVSLEIFEMGTPAAAFGIFTFKRSGKGKVIALGGGAELEDYYLNAWKGRFLVTLTGFDETPETVDGLTAIARAVDSRLRDAGESAAPALAAALPGKGLKPESVKYLKGRLGLSNIYPFYTARGLAFTAAVRGVYESGATLFVLDFGTPDARAGAWADLKDYLAGSDRFKPADRPGADVPIVRDGKGQYVAFAGSGARLLIGVGPTPDSAVELVNRAR